MSVTALTQSGVVTLLENLAAEERSTATREEREATLLHAAAMPQPNSDDGYEALYIEGWRAAIAQLVRRVRAGEHRKP